MNFEELVGDGVVLVDFYTTWCAPCKALSPILAELANVKIVKIDVEENVDLATRYKVNSVPKVIIFKDGVEKASFVGLRTKDELQKTINKLNEENCSTQ